jgi:hypothetical protein
MVRRGTARHRRSLVLVGALLAGCSGGNGVGATPPAAPTETPAAAASEQASSAPASQTPAITGLTGHVVFARAGGQFGDETTFVMNIDGSDLHQIGEDAQSGFPWATADGSHIIVGREEGGRLGASIFDLSGETSFDVPEPTDLMFGSAPFTPDEKFLVAETFTSPGFEYEATNVVEIATGKMRKLVDDKHYISGDVSPDGKQVLLFLNNPTVDPPAPGSLWVIGLDGKGLREVTTSGLIVQCCMNYRWSPDGTKLLFAGPEGSLWTIGVDGSNLTELFHQDRKWAITPTYSPDGSMILFALDRSENPFMHPPNALYVIRADGSDLTLVFESDYFKREPIWLP